MAGEGFALRQQKAPAQRSNELGPQGRYVCNGDQPSTSKLYHGEWDFDTGLCVIPSGRAWDVLRTGRTFTMWESCFRRERTINERRIDYDKICSLA